MAFGLLAMTLCIPSMTQWSATFGASQSQVQLSFSAYVALYGLLQLVHGPLSDRHGRRPVLLGGLALALAGTALAAAAPDLATLVAARALQGAGAAAGMVVGRAMVQDLFDGPGRTRMMAWVGMTMGLCPPLGTVLGGQLHVAFGWRSVFVATLALGAVLLAVSWRLLPREAPRHAGPGGRRGMLQGYARLARTPGFLAYVAMLGSAAATFYAFLAGAPIVFTRQGVPPDHLGYYVMGIPLAYIVGNYATSHLAPRVGGLRMMAIGQGLTLGALALALVLALAGLDHPLALVLPLLGLGIGHGLLMPSTLAGTVGLVPALAGAAAGIAGLVQQMLGAVAGWAVGVVPHDDAANLAWLMLATAALGTMALLTLRPDRPAVAPSL